jgi:hypothetical protein
VTELKVYSGFTVSDVYVIIEIRNGREKEVLLSGKTPDS